MRHHQKTFPASLPLILEELLVVPHAEKQYFGWRMSKFILLIPSEAPSRISLDALLVRTYSIPYLSHHLALSQLSSRLSLRSGRGSTLSSTLISLSSGSLSLRSCVAATEKQQ